MGSAYMGKIMDRGKLLGIQWFSPGTVEEIYDRSTGQITGFKRKIGGKYNTYDAEDVVSIYQTDPLTEIGPGNPIGTAARINADVLHSLNTYLDNVLDNGLLKATLVGVPFGTPKEERDRVERKWFDWFGGSKNGGKIKVVEADAVSVQTIGDGVESLGNLKLSLEQREMIASVMGIPMSIIMSNAANFATAKQDDVSFYTKTIIPQANRIAMKLNRSIFAQTGYRISFEPQRLETLQRHEVEKATSLSQLTGGAPILTVNEARAMLGFDPIDGSAEQAVIGSNLTTPEEAQIQDQARTEAQSESPLSAEQEGEIKAWRKKIKNAKDPLVQFNREHLPLKIYLAIRDRLESGLEVSEAFSPPWDF
ncbi:MAG: phage portal protein [Bacteroidetes bacterium]|nr:phage portal protein [Bacteroidota bacterium]